MHDRPFRTQNQTVKIKPSPPPLVRWKPNECKWLFKRTAVSSTARHALWDGVHRKAACTLKLSWIPMLQTCMDADICSVIVFHRQRSYFPSLTSLSQTQRCTFLLRANQSEEAATSHFQMGFRLSEGRTHWSPCDCQQQSVCTLHSWVKQENAHVQGVFNDRNMNTVVAPVQQLHFNGTIAKVQCNICTAVTDLPAFQVFILDRYTCWAAVRCNCLLRFSSLTEQKKSWHKHQEKGVFLKKKSFLRAIEQKPEIPVTNVATFLWAEKSKFTVS